MATETIEARIPAAKVRADVDAVIAEARKTKRPILITERGADALPIPEARATLRA